MPRATARLLAATSPGLAVACALLVPLASDAARAAADSDSAKDAPSLDLVRFTDGDQLRGQFQGLRDNGAMIWKREDLANVAEFLPAKIRQVILRAGKAVRGIDSPSHAVLVNGDRIPGTIVELDAKKLVLDTSFAGRVSIARDQLAAVAPNPFGGAISYVGPFSEDGWKIVGEKSPEAGKEQAEMPDPTASDADKDKKRDKSAKEPVPPWAFAGTAWYGNNAGPALTRESGLGDASLFRFTVAWRNRLQLNIAFHADFKAPAKKNPEEQPPKEDNKRVQKWCSAACRRSR